MKKNKKNNTKYDFIFGGPMRVATTGCPWEVGGNTSKVSLQKIFRSLLPRPLSSSRCGPAGASAPHGFIINSGFIASGGWSVALSYAPVGGCG